MRAGVCASRSGLSTCDHADVGDNFPIRLLVDAIEAGRLALRERDDRDVPAKLRQIRASSGRTLPPPLAKRLLQELDGDDALRVEAADQLEDNAGQGSVLFLRRPDGWEQEWAAMVDDLEAAGAAANAQSNTDKIRSLEAELRAAKDRVKAATRRVEEAELEAKKRIAASREDIRVAGRAAAQRAAGLEEALAAAQKENEALALELAGAGTELASLRAQLAKRERVQLAAVERQPLGDDPESLARTLDDIAERARRHHEPTTPDSSAAPSLALPPGVAPDRADAVEWLLASGMPQVWLIDGHNLAHRYDPARFTDPGLRVELADAVVSLRRVSLGPLRAVLVFDTGAPVGDEITPSSGLEVRFAGDADAEIGRLADVHGRDAVVVSSDREVRQAAESAGALVIWSDALIEYLQS